MAYSNWIGFAALLSLSAACSAPAAGNAGSDETSPVTSGSACTPLAAPNGSANPAAVYCAELGYTLSGSDCAFPDGTACEEWSFFRGDCGQTHSFCSRRGGSVSNVTETVGTSTSSYAVCTLHDGARCHEDAFASSCTCDDAKTPAQPDAGPTPSNPDAGPAPACTPLPGPTGTANPAAVYCLDLGYALDSGKCGFPDGTSCEQWAFFRGECGHARSFCNVHGGSVANKVETNGSSTVTYAECTLPTGAQCKDDEFAHSCRCE